jgi:hypothetical protein
VEPEQELLDEMGGRDIQDGPFAYFEYFAVNIFSGTKWRKTAFLQKHGIGRFFESGSSKGLQIRIIRLKWTAMGAGDFSDFWRISPGGIYTGGGGKKMLKAEC